MHFDKHLTKFSAPKRRISDGLRCTLSISYVTCVQNSFRTHLVSPKGGKSFVDDRDFIYIRTPPAPSDTAPTDDQQGASSSLALVKARLKKTRQEGFSVSEHDVVVESISAAVAASGRPKFAKLIGMLGPQTGLVVWTLDELGRDAADVLRTVQKLKTAVLTFTVWRFQMMSSLWTGVSWRH